MPETATDATSRLLGVQALLRERRAVEALGRVRALVADVPDHPPCHMVEGEILEALGRPAEALAAYDRALALAPEFPPAHARRAHCLMLLGATQAARQAAETALRLSPEGFSSLMLLGSLHLQEGRTDMAEEAFRRALSQRPGQAFALAGLVEAQTRAGRAGLSLELLAAAPGPVGRHWLVLWRKSDALIALGRPEEAAAVLEEAVNAEPSRIEIREALGRLRYDLGEYDRAAESFRTAVLMEPGAARHHDHLCVALSALCDHHGAGQAGERAVELDPGRIEARVNLGNARKAAGDLEGAARWYQSVLEIDPENAQAFYHLGIAAQHRGKWLDAVSWYERAVTREPRFHEALNNLGTVNNILGRTEQALNALERAAALRPRDPHLAGNVLLTLLHMEKADSERVRAAHLDFGRQIGEPFADLPAAPIRDPDPDRILRIGYLSRDFRAHSVAYFLQSPLAAHDPSQVAVLAYHAFDGQDHVTARLKKHCPTWREVARLSDDKLAELIRHDAVDVLVDLGGHTSGNRLAVFARKPAPIQVAYLGYPATSGLSRMDWRITDAASDPEGLTEDLHTEGLWRVPAPFLCFSPPAEAPAVAPLPALNNGRPTFVSFNKLAKLTDATLTLWGRLLTRLPEARLLVKDCGLDDPESREAFLVRAAGLGLPRQRLEVLPSSPSVREHLEKYALADVALDSFPYHGTTTSCEALWMGLPFVALLGREHRSRVGGSVLRAVGLERLAVRDERAYVEAAVSLVADLWALAKMRQGMRERLLASPLMDGRAMAAKLEAAYRGMWRRAIEGKGI